MDVVIPDLGDFADVPVAELLVAVGDTVEAGQPLVVLESDKSSMEIPADASGVLTELRVSVGDTVSAGTVIAVIDAVGGEAGPDDPARTESSTPSDSGVSASDHPDPPSDGAKAAPPAGKRLVVIGSGPGGYAAAFRAADLGLEVTLVERYESLGGVCLNVGCIPSKALLHAAKVITDAEASSKHGVSFGSPEIDLDALREWKDGVVGKLTGGLEKMAKGRNVTVVTGAATFTGATALEVAGDTIEFDQAIIAAGSSAVELPGIPYDDERVIDSTGALALADVPQRLLVIGGGIIGLEMACVYDALGSEVTVVELLDRLVPEADADLVKPLARRIGGRYAGIHLKTKVESITAKDDGLHASFDGDLEDAVFDRVLVSVGRRPNGASLGLDAAGVAVDDHGFITTDVQQRTNVSHIFAIGDVTPGPMLAHKATAEGHVAAEVAAGHPAVSDHRAIPSVAYTDPEVAWVGLTERKATEDSTSVDVAVFPWAASGRALALDAATGRTKLLSDPATGRVLGGGAVGPGAGELVAEIGLAIEMGAVLEDLAATVHAHPTLSETVMLAAEVGFGTITDLPNPKAMRS
jgi:dihydrolipoamide dehydrogenase